MVLVASDRTVDEWSILPGSQGVYYHLPHHPHRGGLLRVRGRPTGSRLVLDAPEVVHPQWIELGGSSWELPTLIISGQTTRIPSLKPVVRKSLSAPITTPIHNVWSFSLQEKSKRGKSKTDRFTKHLHLGSCIPTRTCQSVILKTELFNIDDPLDSRYLSVSRVWGVDGLSDA